MASATKVYLLSLCKMRLFAIPLYEQFENKVAYLHLICGQEFSKHEMIDYNLEGALFADTQQLWFILLMLKVWATKFEYRMKLDFVQVIVNILLLHSVIYQVRLVVLLKPCCVTIPVCKHTWRDPCY